MIEVMTWGETNLGEMLSEAKSGESVIPGITKIARTQTPTMFLESA